jgi:hypothetical protein
MLGISGDSEEELAKLGEDSEEEPIVTRDMRMSGGRKTRTVRMQITAREKHSHAMAVRARHKAKLRAEAETGFSQQRLSGLLAKLKGLSPREARLVGLQVVSAAIVHLETKVDKPVAIAKPRIADYGRLVDREGQELEITKENMLRFHQKFSRKHIGLEEFVLQRYSAHDIVRNTTRAFGQAPFLTPKPKQKADPSPWAGLKRLAGTPPTKYRR